MWEETSEERMMLPQRPEESVPVSETDVVCSEQKKASAGEAEVKDDSSNVKEQEKQTETGKQESNPEEKSETEKGLAQEKENNDTLAKEDKSQQKEEQHDGKEQSQSIHKTESHVASSEPMVTISFDEFKKKIAALDFTTDFFKSTFFLYLIYLACFCFYFILFI